MLESLAVHAEKCMEDYRNSHFQNSTSTLQCSGHSTMRACQTEDLQLSVDEHWDRRTLEDFSLTQLARSGAEHS